MYTSILGLFVIVFLRAGMALVCARGKRLACNYTRTTTRLYARMLEDSDTFTIVAPPTHPPNCRVCLENKTKCRSSRRQVFQGFRLSISNTKVPWCDHSTIAFLL